MIAHKGSPQVIIHTDFGLIAAELYADRAPRTVANFLRYVDDGFYINTLFHRVIDRFLIQGGGFLPGMVQKTTRPPIVNEADNGLRNEMGTLAMARLPTDPNSATSQFFINTQDNSQLNHRGRDNEAWGYCVFGRVIDGMDTVIGIEGVPTTTRYGHENIPLQDVTIGLIERR